MAFVELNKVGNVAVLTMNRPETLNALSSSVFTDLMAALDVVEKDDEIYCFVITGAGRSFVAGADIGEMLNLNSEAGKKWGVEGNAVMMRIQYMTKPSIAAVNGFALGGGCELALACDIRIASEKAKFGLPEVGLGIMPGFGGTQRLPRLVGTGHAMELILSAKKIDAAYAEKIGLVNRVVEADKLMDEAMELANLIAAQAQVSVRLAKETVHRGLQTDIETATKIETFAFGLCFSTEDQKDAMQGFLEKKPVTKFKNR